MSTREETRETNYILFLCDDLELDDFGCCGGKVSTPNIDRVIQSGMLLRQHYCAAAVCTPSRWEYLTGQYAMRCRSASFREQNPVGETACVVWNTHFDGSTPSVAHHLAAHGYRCGFFGKWHTGPEFRHLAPPELSPDADPADPAVDALLRQIQQRMVEHVCRDGGFTDAAAVTSGNRESCTVKALNRYHNPEWATDAALRFLDEYGAEQPFFLHFATTLPHGDAPDAEIDRDPRLTMGGYLDHVPFGAEKRRTLRQRLQQAGIDPYYHRALAMLSIDDQLGALLDKLDALGIADRTMVVVSCDHNVEPGKGSVYQEGVHIPAAVRWPGLTPAGSTCDAQIMNVDWCPTILADAGLTPPAALDGYDLRSLFDGSVTQVRDHLFFNIGYHRAVSDGRWKYVALRYPRHALARMQAPKAVEAVNHLDNPDQGQACIVTASYPGSLDADQLYDLATDPDEQVNRAGDPACAEHLRRLQACLREIVATVPDHPFDLDDATFLQSERFAALAAVLRRRSAIQVSWWPVGKFPFKDGDRWH